MQVETMKTLETMKRRALPLFASMLALGAAGVLMTASAATAQESEENADEVARKMQAFYDKTKDFQASFKQVYTDQAAGESKTSVGNVYIKKPGMMRWDYYQAGKDKKYALHKSMIADGKAFWIYELEFQQVFKECLSNSKLPTSVSFLMGEGDLLESFDATLTDWSTDKRPVLKLVPKKPTSKYKELRFVLDGGTYQVLKTTIYDPYGNTNEIVFSKVKFNGNLDAKKFQFTPPKSARQLNPEKSCP